jgi:hypothetical protein
MLEGLNDSPSFGGIPGTFKFRAEDQRLRPEQTPAEVYCKNEMTRNTRLNLIFGLV